jgi:hypothetical protein
MNSKDAELISQCMQDSMGLDEKEDKEMDAIVEE